MKNPNLTLLSQLEGVLPDLEDKLNVIMVLLSVIKRPESYLLTEQCICLLNICFSSLELIPMALFTSIWNLLPMILQKTYIYSPQKKPADESLSLVCLDVLNKTVEMKIQLSNNEILLVHALYSTIPEFGEKIFPLFGSAVSGLLVCLDTHRQHARLTEQILNLLQQLICIIGNGDLVAQIAPGILSLLSKHLYKLERKYSASMAAYIQCMGHVIVTIMDNESFEKSKNVSTIHPTCPWLTKRDKGWFEENKKRIITVIQSVLSKRMYDHPKVKLASIHFSATVFRHCHLLSSPVLMDLFETCLIHISDNLPEVSLEAELNAQFLSNILLNAPLLAMLRDRFQFLFKILPKTLKSANESQKAEYLKALSGYLNMFDSSAIMLTHESIATLLTKLMPCVALNKTETLCLEAENNRIDSLLDLDITQKAIMTPWELPVKNFKHLAEQGLFSSLKSFITSLSNHVGIQSMLMTVSNRFLGHSDICSEQIILVNQILDNSMVMDKDTLGIIDDIGRQYLSCLSNSSSPDHDLEKILLLQGIGSVAKLLKHQFQPLLIDGIFAITEKVDYPQVFVSDAAIATLDSIAQSMGVSNTQALLIENMDYLINSVTLKFKDLSMQPTVPKVLNAIVRLAGSASLEYLDDLVEDILDLLDLHYPEDNVLINSLLEALGSICAAKATITAKPMPEIQYSIQNGVSEELLALEKELQEKAQQEQEDIYISNAQSMEEIKTYFEQHTLKEESRVEEPEELPLSRNEKRAERILNQIHYYASHDSPSVRAKILRIISLLLPILRERTKILFPIIHQLWPTVVQRLVDREFYVSLESAKLLSVIAECATDFIHRRLKDDIWPKLQTLHKSICSSQTKIQQGTLWNYKHSVEYKLQVSFLECLNVLIERVPMRSQELHLVCQLIMPFLNIKQFEPGLSDIALKLIERLVFRDPDGVWMCILSAMGVKKICADELSMLPSLSLPECLQMPAPTDIEYHQRLKDLLQQVSHGIAIRYQ